LSAKWRRTKRNLRWFNIFGALNKVKGKNTHHTFRSSNSRIKIRTRPYVYGTPRVHMERRWREPKPLVDVLEEREEVIIVAEFVGFKRESLRIDVKNQQLTLSAEALNRKYHKSLNLPSRVIPNAMCTKYNNGVLEIRLKKAVEEKAINKLVD